MILYCNQGAGAFLEGVQDPQRNFVFAGKFNTANLQNLRTKRCQLEHFFKGDGFHPTSALNDSRIGGINTIYIGVNLAFIRIQRRSNSDRRCVTATSP